MDRLGRQTQVTQHRDVRIQNSFYYREFIPAPFQLYRFSAAFSYQPDGILDALFHAGLVSVEGHVADQQGKGYARSVVRASLRWAASQGAQRAWLQVMTSNRAALNLYTRLGFESAYTYVYRQKGD